MLTQHPVQRRAMLRRTFLRCLVLAVCMFAPFLIIDKGFFLYCGDFNSQQIPFTYYMEGLVKQGIPNYAWATDLGSGFVESYSFYLLGSPFFWLGALLPQSWSPYLMAPLLCLKFAVAGTGAALWARRYTKTTFGAELAAVLYAFSGFTVYNVFFNHFVDVVAVFPFLLWAVDEFFESDRRGPFALMVALCLFVNYFFFVGQVVFIVIYFLMRTIGGDWKLTVKKFSLFTLEAVLGVGMAMVMALPSGLAVLANPRVNDFSTGLDLLFYWRTQQYLAIFTSAFLPQDPSYMPNLFRDCNIKWTSMSLYLPLMGMAGVLTWMKTTPKGTFKRLLVTCAVMAFVPVLNAAFYAFNSSYYCRWYYMPILVMCMATAAALEQAPRAEWLRSTRICGAITAVYVVFALLPDDVEDGGYKLGVVDDPARYVLTLALALGSVLLLYYLLLACRSRAGLLQRCTAFAAMFGVVIGIVTIASGKFPQRYGDADYKQECYDDRIALKEWLDAADDSYFRIDTYESYINLGLWLDRSNLQFFNSTVDASIMEFYPMVGVKRDVSSKPEPKHYALRGLMGVKYLLMPADRVTDFYDDVTFSDEWLYAANVGTYTILENQCYVPIGTTYDYYITQEQYEGLSENNRSIILMRALVLDEDQIARYGDRLQPLTQRSLANINYAAYMDDCAQRAATAAKSFVTDGDGATAHITTDGPELVFFSVPYNKGWSATVNGQTVPVEKVDNGLMAVPVEGGDAEIRLEYRAQGLAPGKIVSVVSFAVWALYAVWFGLHRTRRPLPQQLTPHEEGDLLDAWQPPQPAEEDLPEQPQDGASCGENTLQAEPADGETAVENAAQQEEPLTGENQPAE